MHLFFILLVGCRSKKSDPIEVQVSVTDTPHRLDVWKEATVKPSPDCKDCIKIKSSVAHAGEIESTFYPLLDDAIAQWGDCMESILSCVEADKSPPACVEESKCPAECLGLYRQKVQGVATKGEQLQLILSIFNDEDAPCLPKEEP